MALVLFYELFIRLEYLTKMQMLIIAKVTAMHIHIAETLNGQGRDIEMHFYSRNISSLK